MLDWLRRTAPPPASEQLLEGEGPNPLTDQRPRRPVGGRRPDSRTPGAPSEPAAEGLQEAEPGPPTGDGVAEAPAAEALPEPAPPPADSKKAKKPAPEAVKKPASLREANRKSAKKPAPETSSETTRP